MEEQADNRCPSCGTELRGDGSCDSVRCPTNKDTLRPRHSHTECKHKSLNSGAFQVQRSDPTPLGELVAKEHDGDCWDSLERDIPSQPRVPEFPAEVLPKSEATPPTTRKQTPPGGIRARLRKSLKRKPRAR